MQCRATSTPSVRLKGKRYKTYLRHTIFYDRSEIAIGFYKSYVCDCKLYVCELYVCELRSIDKTYDFKSSILTLEFF